jgi:hypothetical protein
LLDLHGSFMTPDTLFPTAGPDVAEVMERHVPGSICQNTGCLIIPIQGFLLVTPRHRETVQNFVPWRISLRHWEAVFEHDCELAFDGVPFAH